MAASVVGGLRFIIVLIFATNFCLSFVNSHTHSHDHHGHAHDHHQAHDAGEPKHYKYSKQANEMHNVEYDVVEEEDDQYAPAGHHDHVDGHRHHEHNTHEGHAHGGHTHSHGAPEDDIYAQKDYHGLAHDHDHHEYAHESHDHGSHGHGHGHAHSHSAPDMHIAVEQGIGLWIRALGSTALVSSAPVLILLLIPLDNTKEHEPLLKTLLAFAAGGLLGDAFLHLIPHALSPHSHGDPEELDYWDEHGHGHNTEGHAHDHGPSMTIGLWVLVGIISFLSVEKFVRFVKEEVGDSVGHGHSHVSKAKQPSDKQKDNVEKDVDPGEKQDTDEIAPAEKTSETDKKTDEIKEVPAESVKKGDMKVAAYLNLAADAAHNFTDGLAIGVSYLLGQNIGILTTITILLHEVPHEVGDFAILVQSGCSKRKAMMLQFTTAIGAMMGTVVSLLLGGVGDSAMAWILPFTAGGFIYIACVSVIPELLGECKLWQTVKELTALVVGVLMMVIIAGLE